MITLVRCGAYYYGAPGLFADCRPDSAICGNLQVTRALRNRLHKRASGGSLRLAVSSTARSFPYILSQETYAIVALTPGVCFGIIGPQCSKIALLRWIGRISYQPPGFLT